MTDQTKEAVRNILKDDSSTKFDRLSNALDLILNNYPSRNDDFDFIMLSASINRLRKDVETGEVSYVNNEADRLIRALKSHFQLGEGSPSEKPDIRLPIEFVRLKSVTEQVEKAHLAGGIEAKMYLYLKLRLDAVHRDMIAGIASSKDFQIVIDGIEKDLTTG